jgi:TonB family protein
MLPGMRLSLFLFVVVAANAWAEDAGTAFTGTIDETEVRKVVSRNSMQTRFCFEMQNMKTPGLKGHVAVKFVITSTGKVSQAVVSESSLKNAAVEACLVSRVQTWVFPRPTGGDVQFTFPFNFQQAQ